METSWKLLVEALGTAACELSDAGVGEVRAQVMLRGLGRELQYLAAQTLETSARASARGLLLVVERAVKVPEVLVGMTEVDDANFKAGAASTTYVAHAIAESARLQALPLLAQLPEQELRTNFEHEFDAHVRKIKELIAQRNATA